MVHVLAIHVYCERHAHCNLPSEQILGFFFTVCGSQYVNSMKSRQAYLDKLKLLNSALESDFVYNVGNMYL